MTKHRSRLDEISLHFWENCDFTYLGGETYYAKREAILTEVLSEIGPFDSAVDVGCGDGRFTLLVAEFARFVIGYDVSPSLIRAARERALIEGNENARFEVVELGQLPMSDEADLVVCFGVVSCIHEDQKAAQLIDTLKALVKLGGYVLLIDTLGKAHEITKAYRNGYVARYREQAAYEGLVASSGLNLLTKVEIARMGERTVNNLYIFQSTGPEGESTGLESI